MEFDAKDYWDKRLRASWGLHGVGYLAYGIHYNRSMYRVRKAVLKRHIRALNLDLEHLQVLDIGSGTGFYLDLWKSLRVKAITGSDISNVSIERLKRAYPDLSIVQLDIGGSLEAQGFCDTSFNIITAFDVLFHIVKDQAFRQAISNVSRLLVADGYFIFSDNFLHGKTVRSAEQVSRSIEGTNHLLGQAGFRIVKRAPMFVLMNAPIDTGSRWPLLVWRSLMLPVQIIKLLGLLYGAVLFPAEVLLTKYLRESFTTEMMICQKVR